MGAPETTFGQQLRRWRLQRGLSQEALAERAGLTPRAIAALEGGGRRRPYPRTVEALAEALRLAGHERAAFSELAGGAGDPAGPERRGVLRAGADGLARHESSPRCGDAEPDRDGRRVAARPTAMIPGEETRSRGEKS